jgi:hypothetical protein
VAHEEPPQVPLLCAPVRGADGETEACAPGTLPYDALGAALKPLTCTDAAVPVAAASSDAARRGMCVARGLPLLHSDLALFEPLVVCTAPCGPAACGVPDQGRRPSQFRDPTLLGTPGTGPPR